MVVIVIVILRINIPLLASKKLVGERRRIRSNIRDEADRNALHALDIGGNLLPHRHLDGVQLSNGVVTRRTDLDINKEVLPALDALYSSDLSLLAAAILCHQSRPGRFLHVVLDLLVHCYVCQFQHGGLGVSPASLHDHAADCETSNGIKPRSAGQEVAGTDCQKRNESRETVHAMVVRVTSQHRAPLLVCNLHRRPVQPFLNYDAAARQPCCVDVGAEVLRSVAVRVSVTEDLKVREDVCDFGEELLAQSHDCLEADHDAAGEKEARDCEGAQGLDLAVAGWEARRYWFEGVGDGREGHDVRDQVGESVQGVCGQSVYLDSQRSIESELSITGLSSIG